MKQNILKLLFLCILFAPLSSVAQDEKEVKKANYELAAKFSDKNISKTVFSTSISPVWLKKAPLFYYTYKTTEGTRTYLVNPQKRKKTLLYDPSDFAMQLTKATGDPYDAKHLPMFRMDFSDDAKSFTFTLRSKKKVDKKVKKDTLAKDETKKLIKKSKGNNKKVAKKIIPKKEFKTFKFKYDIASAKLTELEYEKPENRPFSWANFSPDSNHIVFSRQYNLYYMDRANFEKYKKDAKDSTIVEHQLTTDGAEYSAYGDGFDATKIKDKKKLANKLKIRHSANILWSPDSRHFAKIHVDNRNVKDLWVINSLSKRPTLETYKYQMPGETESPIYSLCIFDTKTLEKKVVDLSRFKDQTIEFCHKQRKFRSLGQNAKRPVETWLGNEDKFYVKITSRDLKRIDFCEVYTNIDSVNTIVKERMNVYLDTREFIPFDNYNKFLHWSERDGWAHIYVYDNKGNVLRQLTRGTYHVQQILGIKYNKVFFTACGKEEGENPYYSHVYSVNIDGSNLKLLNKGDYTHDVRMDDDFEYFIDNYSRVDCTPKTALYNTKGKKLLELETADLSQLFAKGYKFPERFKVKAGDGITDLYGVMYKPYDFDSTKVYPIIEYVYPGPQTEAVNTQFTKPYLRTDRLAQVGFIVVTVGNRGGHPDRSKWYHTYGYGNMRDYGLEDKKVTIEQLADRFPFIDRQKAGIHGHSGGGFMSSAAILTYPNLFKVAVSCAGNHENSIYNRWWSEKHHGVNEEINTKGDTIFKYSVLGNSSLAKNLKGKLLLVHGDMDNNVHPANTIKVMNALIKAGKRYDFLLLPGSRHGFNCNEYFFWRLADYFSRNLMGDKTERDTDIYYMHP